MSREFFIYNTLSRKKEKFEPYQFPYVGLYVCGPTVYSDPHLGHARPAVTFDILFRYLRHLDYKVRYVRNITDVGHLEDEVAGAGEDRIQKKARLEQLEPMEIVQYYTNRYHLFLDKLGVIPPSIEPLASGHIIEQQQLIQSILDKGFAYEVKGSVYFDLKKYHETYGYGKLSGRNPDEMLSNTRELEGQDEKRYPLDFALWKKADPLHIMHWPSAWSEGFPGWHLECSAMGMKYLGAYIDIHGGGMDLIFPHHECELAQSTVATGKPHVKYWMHNNMITINGQKMARSKNNFITLEEIFTGKHPLLERAYSPMTIRFYILQAHYSSPVDFSNDSLKAADQGLSRLLKGVSLIKKLKVSEHSTVEINTLIENLYTAMSDDLNTPGVISYLFEGVKIVHTVNEGKATISESDLKLLNGIMNTFVFDLLGLMNEETETSSHKELLDKVIQILLQQRHEAKIRKDYAASDSIRNQLAALGISVKDTKDGAEWELE
jgi:cysteinyl-tRNA synthetase